MDNLTPETKKLTSKEILKKRLESINEQMPYISNGAALCMLFPNAYRWSEEINGKKYICFGTGNALSDIYKFHESWWRAEYKG